MGQIPTCSTLLVAPGRWSRRTRLREGHNRAARGAKVPRVGRTPRTGFSLAVADTVTGCQWRKRMRFGVRCACACACKRHRTGLRSSFRVAPPRCRGRCSGPTEVHKVPLGPGHQAEEAHAGVVAAGLGQGHHAVTLAVLGQRIRPRCQQGFEAPGVPVHRQGGGVRVCVCVSASSHSRPSRPWMARSEAARTRATLRAWAGCRPVRHASP